MTGSKDDNPKESGRASGEPIESDTESESGAGQAKNLETFDEIFDFVKEHLASRPILLILGVVGWLAFLVSYFLHN